MKQKSTEFLKRMLKFLPSTEAEYRSTVEFNNGVLETVIIEDVFMPEIIKLLKEDTNIDLLERIFNYFEEVSHTDDAHLLNIFSVTALEILGNEREILETARKYMGPKTFKLQIEADRALGREV